MENLKVLMIGLLVSAAAAAFGQKKEMSPEKWSEKHLERISEVIPDLTDEQKAKLKKADLAQLEERQALRDTQRENRQEMRDKMQSLRQEKMTSYKEILTQEQYIKLLEHKKENRGKRNKSRKDGHKGKRGDWDKKGSKQGRGQQQGQ